MRYLYRSYCLKEGAFGRGILRSWMEVKQQRTEKVYRRKEGRGWGVETDVTTQHLKGWSEKAVFLDTKLGLRVHESLYHWGIYTHWVKSTTRQVCGRGGCGRCGAGRGGAGVGLRLLYFFWAASRESTSSSGLSTCHWAMGLLGLASISDQWRISVPELFKPTNTLPIASFLPILS